MKKSNKKFVFTKALYSFLWIFFGFMCFKIFLFATVEITKYGTPLYENGAWDVLQTIGLLIFMLSFKDEDEYENESIDF
jgi:hypothetical protein